jgi:hypothetical protein
VTVWIFIGACVTKLWPQAVAVWHVTCVG